MIDHSMPAGSQYAQLMGEMASDGDLTAMDWRVMVSMLSKTANWRVSPTQVANEIKTDRRSVIRSLNRLTTLGYVQPILNKSGRERTDYWVAKTRRFAPCDQPVTVTHGSQVETLGGVTHGSQCLTSHSDSPVTPPCDSRVTPTVTHGSQGCDSPVTLTVTHQSHYEEINEELVTKSQTKRQEQPDNQDDGELIDPDYDAACQKFGESIKLGRLPSKDGVKQFIRGPLGAMIRNPDYARA